MVGLIQAPVKLPQFDENGNVSLGWKQYYSKIDAKRKELEERIETLEP